MRWLVVAVLAAAAVGVAGHSDAIRLHDDLLSDYNRLIRPVSNHSSKVIIGLGLKLTQLIDITWHDYKLTWDPNKYGGVEMIHVPAEHIWLPDIVLFNNYDGNYEVTLMTKAIVYFTGDIVWNPPALYRSTCEIDVEYFPFDEQSCLMKFGSWTYDGYEVDLRHKKQKDDDSNVAIGIDMSEFYKSVEWDILLVPAKYNREYYECCSEPYPDITFNITMRRKTLFYTVNLIIPCVGISFLTVLVFYLPSDSGEKVSLSISILVSLTVFFLLLAEIIPPTSLAVPLLGKYLLFTMILVTLSIAVTVGVLNVHFRSPSTHKMSHWVRRIFIHVMPRLLLMRRPLFDESFAESTIGKAGCNGLELPPPPPVGHFCRRHPDFRPAPPPPEEGPPFDPRPEQRAGPVPAP
ncbi:nAChRa8 [Cordylochernes scorpioides]|uniref:NAChRa8 n=1 Tax=Cordylochernes scorpioides TaxID=51811 RepID=A0ABY6L4D6_9ARAC|nr:nAChRa8 [Cordylochernes scorpioides]